jgi:DNA polymerase V
LFHPEREKQCHLGYVMDSIRDKYGSKALLKGVSYTDAGTALQRANLVDGHKS